jgi:phosphatidylinositol glycan class O
MVSTNLFRDEEQFRQTEQHTLVDYEILTSGRDHHTGGSSDHEGKAERVSFRRRLDRLILPGGRATVLAMVVFFILQFLGLYIFTRGFLLTRLALEASSQCSVTPITVSGDHQMGASFEQGCWHERRFKRAIVIIIDALRFDFAVYNESYTGSEHFRNGLPVLHDKLVHQPEHAALFEAIADPPTTTLQRLKGMTTGTLPTFIDAGTNFIGSAITEDNWVAQAKSQGLRVWQMGDDTWMALYPHSFDEAHPFPSLNVWDLHTVDNGILDVLPDALGARKHEWDILVAHYLGVDHCGHRYGSNHPAMSSKLKQMNNMLEDLMQKMDDDTVLFVLGDHGMDVKGDHGGDSEVEVQAALFIYSKTPFLAKDRSRLNAILNELANTDPEDDSLRTFIERSDVGRHRTVPQIDLVPTISMLLGLPIPYSNLGMIIPELFLTPSNNGTTSYESVRNLVEVARMNAHQLYQYVSAYAGIQPSGEVANELKSHWQTYFNAAEELYTQKLTFPPEITSTRDAMASEAELYKVFLAYVKFMRTTLSSCRRIWAQFDVPLMRLGAVMLAITVGCGFYVMRQSTLSVSVVMGWIRGMLMGVLVAIIFHRSRLLHPLLEFIGFEVIQRYDQAIMFTFFGFIISLIYYRDRTHTTSLYKTWSIDNIFACIVLFVAQSLLFSSNSFVIFEDKVTLGLLQTYAALSMIRAIFFTTGGNETTTKYHRRWILWTLIFMVLGRLSGHRTICREEQGDACTPNFYTGVGASASQSALIQMVALTVLIPWILRRRLEATDSFHGAARLWIDWGLRAALLFSAAFWIMEDAPHDVSATVDGTEMHDNEDNYWEMLKRFLARLGFGMSLVVGMILWWHSPLCMNVSADAISNAPSRSSRRRRNTNSTETRPVMKILGFDNAYGAAYFIFAVVIYSALAQTQQPTGAISLAIGLCHYIAFAEMLSAQRALAQHIPTAKSIQPTPLIMAVIAGLLAQHYYFTTGHQATIVSIQWRVGFIGLREINWLVSPILVTSNTLAAHLFVTVALPLLILWRVSPRTKTTSQQKGYWRIWPHIHQLTFAWMLVWLVLTTALCTWCIHHRRHLMVWKVWAPRFMLAALTSLICQSILIGITLLVGVMHVARRVGQILMSNP